MPEDTLYEVHTMPEDTLYQAFILYPDAAPEKKIAEKLEREIRKFKIPSKIKCRLTSKDLQKTSSLSVPFENPDDRIGEKTDEALRHSRFLILICSPRTVAAPMITPIIQRFMDLGKRDQILTLLVSGTPAESFPPVLLGGDQDAGNINPAERYKEPLAANICAKDEKASLKRLKDFEKYRLIAPILGCEFYDLKQTHRVWERQSSLLKILVTSLALFLAGIFYLNRALAVHSEISRLKSYQALNTDIISEIYQTIPEKLKGVPGAELMLQEVLWSRADIQQLIKERQKSASSQEQQENYDLQGTQITDDGRKQILRSFRKLKEKDFDRLLIAFDKVSPAEGIDDFYIRLFLACQENRLRYRDDFKTAARMIGIKGVDDFDIRPFLARHENELRYSADFKAVARLIEEESSMSKRTFRTGLFEFFEHAGQWTRRIKFQRIIKFLEKVR